MVVEVEDCPLVEEALPSVEEACYLEVEVASPLVEEGVPSVEGVSPLGEEVNFLVVEEVHPLEAEVDFQEEGQEA